MKKTSLADIAKSLNVSKALVSIVLNGKGDAHGINEDTQKRVLAKAKELNYKPNAIARGLRTGKSNTLGLIVADISNAFYAKICRAIEEKAWKKGYHLMISSSEENPERESELIRVFQRTAGRWSYHLHHANGAKGNPSIKGREIPICIN